MPTNTLTDTLMPWLMRYCDTGDTAAGTGLGLVEGVGDGGASPAAAAWAARVEALHGGNCKLGLVVVLVRGFTRCGMLGSGLHMAELFLRSLHPPTAAVSY